MNMSESRQDYSVIIIDTPAAFADLRKEWNDLLTESKANTIFLTWEWLYTWSQYFLGTKRTLFILAIYERQELVALAPWCIRQGRYCGLPLRTIELLGTPETGSDYLDVLCKTRKERAIAQVLYRFLYCDVPSRWDRLALCDIPAESLFLLHFSEECHTHGKHVERELGSFCPRVQLPEHWDGYLAQWPAVRRRRYLRDARILTKNENLRHRSARGEDSEDLLPTFLNLYARRWTLAPRDAEFLTALAVRVAKKGWLQIDLLEADSRAVGGIMHLSYEGTLFCYRMAFDRSYKTGVHVSLGSVLVGLVLESAIEQRYVAYDFLKGSEEYKFMWSDSGRSSVNLVTYQPRALIVLSLAAQSCRRIAKILRR